MLWLSTWAGAASSAPTYTVRPGDTAYSVARQAGTDVPTLLRLNDLSAPDLKVGQVLRLPAGAGQPPAAAFQASPVQVNAGPASVPAASAIPRTHTVAAGQTLYSVARLYGLKAADLQAFNHLASADLKPGQVLRLPGGVVPPEDPVAARPAPSRPGQGSAVPDPQVPARAVPARGASQAVASLPDPALSPASGASLTEGSPHHLVQPGQTLYAIARLYGVKVADLLALNHLTGDDLRPGQLLLLPAGSAGQAAPALGLPVAGPAGAVQQGAQFSPGVPLPPPPTSDAPHSGLPPLQNGQSDSAVSGPVQPSLTPDSPVPDWRSVAVGLLGVPYVYGGNSRSGTDCSGLVLQVFAGMGLNLPRQSALQARTGVPVQLADLQPGDLLFFDTEGRGEATHVGIYLGEYGGLDGAFINANSYGGQVAINTLSEKYFAQRYLWARRVLGVLAQGR